jgi:transcription-repair coupling factor (superfamily II helicase)
LVRVVVQKNRRIKLAGNDKLRIERDLASSADRGSRCAMFLRALGTPVKQAA